MKLSPGKENGKQLSVSTDDREACAEMTRYLAGLGHTRIAYITGDPHHAAVANRFLGYQDGLRESGLEFSERLIAAGNTSFESGASCAENCWASRLRRAIFAANDDMAAGVVRVANGLGIDIPGQLSVAGFDDIPLARQVDPALTTIRQPLVRMTEKATSLLVNRNGNGNGNGTGDDDAGPRLHPAKIKIRESTGPAPNRQRPANVADAV